MSTKAKLFFEHILVNGIALYSNLNEHERRALVSRISPKVILVLKEIVRIHESTPIDTVAEPVNGYPGA